MSKKKQFKSMLCMFMTFIMVFTSVDSGIVGIRTVFAEAAKEDSSVVKTDDKITENLKKDDMDLKVENKTTEEKKESNLVIDNTKKDETVIDSNVQTNGETNEAENSKIGVDGIEDGKEFTNSNISFLAWSQDGSEIIVKLNDEILKQAGIRQGLYFADLKPGKNIITIETKDENKNLIKKTYNVTYKVEDTEKPKIEVIGITNDEEVNTKEISFKVMVTDNVDKNIKPAVRLNGEGVTETNGEYKVTLKDGENTITIEATDAAGNRADETYKITYIKSVDKDKLRKQVEEAIEKASKVVVDKGNNGYDWVVIGLARAGKSDRIASNYLKETVQYLKNPENQGAFKSKPTEFERITLAVLAAGGDPTNIGGINLIKQIYTTDLSYQGINALVFGLIAFDAGEYYVPSDAKNTREELIQEILSNQCDDGGWSFGGDEADPDMTGMTMTALAPYNNDKYPEVQEAIKRAVECLSSIQEDNGGYASWRTINSESCSQVIMGLCTNGIDPTEKRFTKKGNNVLDALLTFEVDGGGFDHTLDGKKHFNPMATEQALYALDQYIYFLDKKGSIYQWGKQKTTGDKTVTVRIEGKDKVIVPNTDFTIKGDNPTIKEVVKQVLQSKAITFTEDNTGFNSINNETANESNNEKWLCSVENCSIIKDMSSRNINNYENIVVYLGKNSENFTYTWIKCSKASIFKPQEAEIFTGSDVKLNVKGCKNNGYYMTDNIVGAAVYLNGQQYKKDGQDIVTDESGEVTFNFDKPGNYEVTIKKDNMRTANFLVKVIGDTEPPTVEFWPENIEEKIEKDQVQQIVITPKDNKDGSKDVDIFVKLNGKELRPDKIRDSDGSPEFNNVVFDKYDNLFEVKVTDKSGNTQTIEKHVINANKSKEPEDAEKPVIKVEGIKDGQEVNEANLSFKVIVIDNIDKDIKPIVRLNGEVVIETNGEYKVTLKDGENTITIEATDAAGNRADETYKITYKKEVVVVNPTIKSITPVSNIEVEHGTAKDEAIKKLAKTTTIKDSNDKEHTVNLTWTIENYDGNKAGEYTAEGRFSLPAGVDQAAEAIELKVIAKVIALEENKDTEKPVIKVEGIKDEQEVNEANLSFKVMVTDNVDKDIKPIVRLNGEVVIETNGEYKVTLKDGENTITIEATDAAGNRADETYKIIYKKELLDKKNLEEKINKVKTLKKDKYTKSAWINIQNSVKNAEEKLNKKELTQQEIKNQITILNNILTSLRPEVEDGYVTVCIEKFTIGQGYIMEPVLVKLEKGDTAYSVVERVFGEKNFKTTGKDSTVYIAKMRDKVTDKEMKPSLPPYLQKVFDKKNLKIGKRESDEWLTEFDFYKDSGWMICTSEYFMDRSAGAWEIESGDVVRWQFTLYGYGEDLGSSFMNPNPIVIVANRDAILTEIAKINKLDLNNYTDSQWSKIENLKNEALEITKDLTANQNAINAKTLEIREAVAKVKGEVDVNPTIKSITPVSNVEVEYGTTKDEAIKKLAKTTTIKDSNDKEYTVNLTWTIENYDGNKAGEYTAEGRFSLPAGVDQAAEAIELKVTAKVNVKEEQGEVIVNPTIKSITPVSNVEVEHGTAKDEAIKKLAKTTTIKDSNDKEYTVNLTWTIENYDGNKAGEYTAEGRFSLPAGVDQAAEAIELKVTAKINVKEENNVKSVKEQLNKNLAYILKTVKNPSIGTGHGEWSILCLARGNYAVPDGYYDKYYSNVVKRVQDSEGVLHKVKYTEHSRLILGLTSIGKDVTDVGGYNQLEKLADFNTVIKQGINGPIWALIALDTKGYEIPKVEGVEVQTTRDMLIQYILDKEINKGKENAGGWSLGEDNSDPDVTSMAIQALTPYYKTNSQVKAAVDRAVLWLSNEQRDDGGYISWRCVNSESVAQVVVALTGLGIDPHTDKRFVKNGNSAIDALLSFTVPEGGFMHVKPGYETNGGAEAGVVDGMATDQGTYALVAYDRFINNKNRLYDMTDANVKPEEPTDPEGPTDPEDPKDTEKPSIIIEGIQNNQEVKDEELSFRVTVTDNVDKDIAAVVKLNGQVITGINGEYKVQLKDGENVIEIEAVDKAGNKANEVYKVIKIEEKEDTEAPKIEVTGLKNSLEVTNSNLSFKVTVTDNVDKDITAVVKLNGKVVTETNGEYKVQLKDGDNTITVEAVDKAGNKASQSYAIKHKVVEIKVEEEIKIEKGTKNHIKVTIENISEKDKEITLALVLYDKNTNEMMGYKFVKKLVKVGENGELKGQIEVPQEGEYLVKVIFCDDLSTEKMNVLTDPILVEVK